MVQQAGNLTIEGAELMFRNFQGKEDTFNAEGDRNFCIRLEPDVANQMMADGWNVRHLRPQEGEEVGTPYVQVSVKYRGRDNKKLTPPKIVLISSKGRVDLTEDEAELIDWVDIKNVDLVVRPHHWSVNGKSGVKAYLKSMFVTIEEDYLDQKYSEIPYAGSAAISAAGTPLELENSNIVDAEVIEENE